MLLRKKKSTFAISKKKKKLLPGLFIAYQRSSQSKLLFHWSFELSKINKLNTLCSHCGITLNSAELTFSSGLSGLLLLRCLRLGSRLTSLTSRPHFRMMCQSEDDVPGWNTCNRIVSIYKMLQVHDIALMHQESAIFVVSCYSVCFLGWTAFRRTWNVWKICPKRRKCGSWWFTGFPQKETKKRPRQLAKKKFLLKSCPELL